MKELRQEYLSRVRTGRMSVLQGELKNVISGLQRDSVQKETPAVSATKTIRVKRRRNGPLLLGDRRGEVVHPEGTVKNRARIPQRKLYESVVWFVGIVSYVKITELNRDVNSAISACSGTLRLTVNPATRQRRVVEKDRLHC